MKIRNFFISMLTVIALKGCKVTPQSSETSSFIITDISWCDQISEIYINESLYEIDNEKTSECDKSKFKKIGFIVNENELELYKEADNDDNLIYAVSKANDLIIHANYPNKEGTYRTELYYSIEYGLYANDFLSFNVYKAVTK